MSQFFFRSRRLVQDDSFAGSFWFLSAAAAVLALWIAWFFRMPVAIYEVSAHARVETASSVFDIAAPFDGTVSEMNLVVGRKFAQGDTLIAFDTGDAELSLKEVAARHEKARAEFDYAREENRRLEKLRKLELLSEIEIIKSRTEVKKLDEAAKALKAEKELLEYRLKRHVIVAPFAGVIGSVNPVEAGAVLKEKDSLGTLVPAGEYKIVAYYHPAAVGRIQPGQTARLKLDGFPWTRFGAVQAEVRHVANESVAQGIKVEYALKPGASPEIPFQHGLTGTLETLVDHKTPAEMVSAAAGKIFSPADGSP